MKITIHGTGYVGLVTGACLADIGHEVLCIDTDLKKVAELQKGRIPIFEPGLEQLVKENQFKGNLTFSSDINKSLFHSAVHFIAVGTPSDEDGASDMKSVLTVARSIAEVMDDYRLIVTKSTVPVGSGTKIKDEVNKVLNLRKKEVKFSVASNPEFLKEGNAVNDFMKPDRIVIGSNDSKAESILKEIYNPFVKRSYRIITTTIESAELAKYAANAMLATRISFMNELAKLSEKLGSDIEEVRQIIGYDARIGNSFLYPGIGFGGSCFPKDLRALKKMALDEGLDPKILEAVIKTNLDQKIYFVNKILDKFNGNIEDKVFTVWGLSFKPQTDDIRESPSISIIKELIKRGAKIQAYDPVVDGKDLKIEENFMSYENQYAALEESDALIVATEWKAFWQPDFKEVGSLMKNKIIFDGRNIYDQTSLNEMGFDYICIGR